MWVFRFAIGVSRFWCPRLRTCSVQLIPKWQVGLGKDGKAGVPAAVRGMKATGVESDRTLKEVRKITRLEGLLRCALTRNLTTDDLSEHGEVDRG